MLPLILASSSPYRRELLARLHLPFEWASPDIDEHRNDDETATALVKRLAREKAHALAGRYPAHLIIGSDQVAVLGEQILGKPHTFDKACEQLLAASGNHVTFLTGVALLNTQTGQCQVDCVPFSVHMRELTLPRIERYLRTEQPYDCAGSFKCEGLGISLFEAIDNRDPSALIGLPLIALCRLLRKAGFAVP